MFHSRCIFLQMSLPPSSDNQEMIDDDRDCGNSEKGREASTRIQEAVM